MYTNQCVLNKYIHFFTYFDLQILDPKIKDYKFYLLSGKSFKINF